MNGQKPGGRQPTPQDVFKGDVRTVMVWRRGIDAPVQIVVLADSAMLAESQWAAFLQDRRSGREGSAGSPVHLRLETPEVNGRRSVLTVDVEDVSILAVDRPTLQGIN